MIECRWDEGACKQIAKESGVAQTIKDVSFARFLFHHSKKSYILMKRGEFFLLGNIKRDALRIIGIAVIKELQGKGIGRKLLNRAKYDAMRLGLKKLETRSTSGKDFYLKNGFEIIDIYNNGDLKFEFKLR